MTQNDEILRHLQNGLTLTPLQALRQYGTLRLAARIYELRKDHDIRMDMVKKGKKRVAEYALVR